MAMTTARETLHQGERGAVCLILILNIDKPTLFFDVSLFGVHLFGFAHFKYLMIIRTIRMMRMEMMLYKQKDIVTLLFFVCLYLYCTAYYEGYL